MQIDFSAAFDRVNHQGILYNLSCVGIRCSVLSILTQFLSTRSQQAMVDGCRSKLANVLSGVPQASVLGQLLFLLYTLEPFSIADDSSLIANMPSPGVRFTVADSRIRDFDWVSEWCIKWCP